MTMRMSFCLKAIKTLDPRDLNALTDAIEVYVKGGMETVKAEHSAVADLLAGVRAERAEMQALAKDQLAVPVAESATPEEPAAVKSAPTPKESPNDAAPEINAPAVDSPLADGLGNATEPFRGTELPRGGDGPGDGPDLRVEGRRADSENDEGENLGDGTGSEGVPDQAQPDVGGSNERVHARDFHPRVGGLTREGSWFDTAARNIDLIELALKIESEGRPADAEEQELLSKYVGFGAGEIRNNLFPVPSQWDRQRQPDRLIWPELVRDKRWKPLAERMAALPVEWQRSVLQSTQYAHYTSEGIIRGVWQGLQRIGFTGGKVLEPGMGIGSFQMLMPEIVRDTSKYTGIEFDGPTALIARLLSPQQNMLHEDFIKRKLPRDYFDIGVGNPPFSQTKVLADPDYEKFGFMLHDFFFAKTLDRVRPGGLLVFVTSHGTMDKQSDKARRYMAERADLIGAVRLPQTAFEDNAGTKVVTDVLFLRKRLPGEAPGGEAWGKSVGFETKDGPTSINEYFVAHPEMVLGQQRLSGFKDDQGNRISGLRSDNEYTVVSYDSTPAELDAKFAAAVEKLPANVYSSLGANATQVKRETAKADFNPSVKREGVVYVNKDGDVMRVENGIGVDLGGLMKLSDKDREWFKGYVGLRDAVNLSRLAQATDGDWQAAQKALNKAYDAFRKQNGPVLAFRTITRNSTDDEGNPIENTIRIFTNRRLLREDYDSAIVTQLETVNDEGEIVKGKFMQARTIGKPSVPEIRTVGDALAVSLDSIGHLDLADIASRAGVSMPEAIDALGASIYKTPQGEWQLSDEYLSGDVRTKLADAELAARDHPELKRNVEALKAVQPERLGPSQISVKLGASWVKAEYVNEFAKVIDAGGVSFDPHTESWQVAGGADRSARRAGMEYGTAKRSPSELLEAALNSRTIVIKEKVDKKEVTDKAATDAANEAIHKIREKFRSWVWTDSARATDMIETYNDRFNNIAARRFDGSHLTLPGVSLRYQLHDHQKRAIWRQIQTGNTYLAHAVGAGKTIEMIAGGMEQKRLGLINKPMYTVPNHMLEQFASEFMDLYPLANIMVADDENFSAERRKNFVAAATLNAPDAIIITHSAFERIGIKEETVAPIRDEILADLQDAMAEISSDKGERVRRGQLQQQIEAVEQRFDSIIGSGQKDSTIKFEDIGADFLYADEAHTYRKLDFTTNQKIKGIDPNGSRRALDMYVKTRFLDRERPGRSFVFASGTPVTNTMGELYTIMRFFDPAELARTGTSTFDGWARQYGQAIPELEANATGRYETVTRFVKFENLPELMSRVRQFMDVLTSEHLGALVKRPDIEGGKPELVTVEKSPDLTRYMKEVLAPRLEVSRAWKPSIQQPNNPDPVIAIISDGRFAALDPRFFGANIDENKTPTKLTAMADQIIAEYKATAENQYVDVNGNPVKKGGTQIVFFNYGFGAQSMANRGFDARATLMRRLTRAGVRRDDIIWFDDANTDAKKGAAFKRMRSGDARVLIGSAKKMGTGVNVQNRLTALHYFDPPWFPADVEQPMGRIIRQGNLNPSVRVKWYATKGTYDSTMWQMVARKRRFIDQAFAGDKSVRTMEDMSEASAYELAAALASGDPRAMQLAGLRQDVERYERLQAAHSNEQVNATSALRSAGWEKQSIEARIATYAKAFKAIGESYFSFGDAKIGGETYAKPGEFNEAFVKAFNQNAADFMVDGKRIRELGSIGPVSISMEANFEKKGGKEVPDGTFSLAATIGGHDFHLLHGSGLAEGTEVSRRVVNAANSIDGELRTYEDRLKGTLTDIVRLTKKVGAPFEYEQELAEKFGELKMLEAELAAEGLADAKAVRDGMADKTAPAVDEDPYDNILDTLHGQMAMPTDAENETDVVFGTDSTQYLTNPDRQGKQATIDTGANSMQKADSAATWLAESATEPWVREVAGKLAPYIDSETTIRYLEAGKPAMVTPSVGAAFQRGIFGLSEVDPVSGRASLYFKYAADRPVGQEDMLHELLHAATQRALSITRSATIRAELESIRAVLIKTFNQVLTSPRASEQARNDAEFFSRVIEDEHELLAYGMTSRTFRKWAQSLDASGRIIKSQPALAESATPPLTLWQRFVDAVRALIGLSKMYQQRLDALLSRKEADALAFRTANTPETLAKRLDALLQQTLDLRVGADEYSAGWSPRKGTSVASDQPFYSEMARQVERSAINTAPAGGWSQFFRGLVNKGTVKADEVAWSGIEDWLATKPGKVTREQVAAFLDANGVKVTETTLGGKLGADLPAGWRVEENDNTGTWHVLDEENDVRGQGDSHDDAIRDAQDLDDSGVGGVGTKYSQYTLPGGTNYREVLLTLPVKQRGEIPPGYKLIDEADEARADGLNIPAGETGPWRFKGPTVSSRSYKTREEAMAAMLKDAKSESENGIGLGDYRSSHWDQPNVLAHIRLNDRTDAEGKRVLFVEEIQSDWAQQGKKDGFSDRRAAQKVIDSLGGQDPMARANELEAEFKTRTGKPAFVNGRGDDFIGPEADEWNRIIGALETLNGTDGQGQIPAAPFVGKTDAWVALAIKRVIKMAVDEGYDRVAFVNGEQSAQRYRLSTQVRSIEWTPASGMGVVDGATHVILDTLGGLMRFNVSPDGQVQRAAHGGLDTSHIIGKQLDDVIGKAVAEKIMGAYKGKLEDAGLDIGGEGMKAFYDKIVPSVAKDVLRKVGGGAMGAVQIEAGTKPANPEALQFQIDHPESYSAETRRLAAQELAGRTMPQPGFDITPAMRQKAEGPLQLFGTAEVLRTVRNIDQTQIRNTVMDALTSHGSTNLWERTVGTQYAKAQKNPKTFGRVFNAVQDYIKDITIFANAAADNAPDILPKLDSLSDLRRKATPKADIDLAGAAAFAGTLKWSRDENGELIDNEAAIDHAETLTTDQKARVLFKAGLVTEAELKRWQATPLDIYDGAVRNRYEQKLLRPGVVFSDAELSERFKMNPKQIDLYRQFRASVDQSLDDLGRTELVRLAGKTVGPATTRLAESAADMAEAAAILSEKIDQLTEDELSAADRDVLTELRNDINDKANRVAQLKADGYAPLMRFGEHTLTVTGESGEIEFFGLYESNAEANRTARLMKDEFPRSTITQGKMSKEAFKLFKGVDLNALELFAETTGMADNAVYQDYLRLTKNNRSAMKRMIHRKGISGFNENTARVLASFVTSNARMASGNLHMGEAVSAAAAIPKEMGDLKDEATKLVEYVQNPGEEAAAMRSLLFVNFIGGSVASAMVNLTQPFTMSLPYLGQFGGLVNAGKHLLAAARAAGGGKVSPEMQKLLHDNADLVSPQEIHHLNSEVQDQMGNHPMLKKGLFLWGSMFSLSEQFNRRVTFIAAHQTALEQGMADPVEFARKAVIETQGLYNKGNKPNWARGAIGATVMTFKQFSIHYLEFLTRMWKSGPEGKKAVGAALAILVLAAGAGGLPFADDLDDLIDTLAQAMGYDFSSKRAKRKFIADQLGEGAAEFLTRGASGIAGMPIDVSLRMSMGNLIPMTGVLLRSNTDRMKDVAELGGAAGSLLKTGIEAGAQALHGEFAKAGLSMAPLAVQNMAKAAEMFNTGEYHNTKGQMVTHVDVADSASKFLGFQPAGVAKESSRMREVQRSVSLARNVESEIAGKWAQGLSENRHELVKEARADLADWNAKNDNTMHITMQQIIQRVRDMRSTRAERTVKSAPREMRSSVRETLQ